MKVLVLGIDTIQLLHKPNKAHSIRGISAAVIGHTHTRASGRALALGGSATNSSGTTLLTSPWDQGLEFARGMPPEHKVRATVVVRKDRGLSRTNHLLLTRKSPLEIFRSCTLPAFNDRHADLLDHGLRNPSNLELQLGKVVDDAGRKVDVGFYALERWSGTPSQATGDMYGDGDTTAQSIKSGQLQDIS